MYNQRNKAYTITYSMVMTCRRIDMKFNGGISNSIFSVIREALAVFYVSSQLQYICNPCGKKYYVLVAFTSERNITAFYTRLSTAMFFFHSLQKCTFCCSCFRKIKEIE